MFKPCKWWDKLPINWCGISAINSITIGIIGRVTNKSFSTARIRLSARTLEGHIAKPTMENGVANAQVRHQFVPSSSLTSCHIQLQNNSHASMCLAYFLYTSSRHIHSAGKLFNTFFNLQSSEFVHIHPTRKLTIASKKHQKGQRTLQ